MDKKSNHNIETKINSKEIAQTLFNARQEFVVLGLCGKTGSGVSTVAKILSKEFNELNLPAPCEECRARFDKTEYRILYNYAKKNWKPFHVIKTSALITLTALNTTPKRFSDYLFKLEKLNCNKQKLTDKQKSAIDRIKAFFNETISFKLDNYLVSNLKSEISNNEIVNFEKYLRKNNIIYLTKNKRTYTFTLKELAKLFFAYKKSRNDKIGINNYLVHEVLFQFIYSKKNKGFQDLVSCFWSDISRILKLKITTMALQDMGNNLRITKSNPFNDSKNNGFVSDGFLSIAELINISIKLIRDCKIKKIVYCEKYLHGKQLTEKEKSELEKNKFIEKQAFIVIDSIKNPFESNYLKDRYSNYYLMTVYTDEDKRQGRLVNNKKLERKDIKAIDIIEQLTEFKNIKGKYNKIKEALEKEEDQSNKNELNKKLEELLGGSDKIKSILDKMIDLKEASIYPFIMQNVESCIDLADIFINNEDDSSNHIKLKKIMLRYISLIMYPGLVLPTAVERCMQTANTAKSCSGCISRQVGAVLTDNNYNLKAIGWNHVPENHIPCLYRDINEVYSHCNEDAYSTFENDENNKFQESIKTPVEKYYSKNPENINDTGRTIPYCFKDIYNEILGIKNQIHPRALHAEETAFLNLSQMGTGGIDGGYLFTTSSPCELCAKKAMYLGIAKVYYIQPYPGISRSHILNAGPSEKRPEMILYTGAIGRAYTQLYTPLIPKKDEMELWLKHKVSIKNYPKEKA